MASGASRRVRLQAVQLPARGCLAGGTRSAA